MIRQTTLPPRLTSTPVASIASERMNLFTAGDASSTLTRFMMGPLETNYITPTWFGENQLGHLIQGNVGTDSLRPHAGSVHDFRDDARADGLAAFADGE